MEGTMSRLTKCLSVGGVVLVFVALLGLIVACDNGTSSRQRSEQSEETAAEALEELNALLADVDWDNPLDTFTEAAMADLRSAFQAALDLDINNPTANLGMGLVILMEAMATDSVDTVLSMSSTAGSSAPGSPEYSLGLAASVLGVAAVSPSDWPEDLATIGAIQDQLATTLEEIEGAGVYLDRAVDNLDDAIIIQVEGESVRIEQAEAKLFRAGVGALRSVLSLALVYDMELYAAAGEPFELEDLTAEGGEEAIMEALVWSLRESDTFLTRREGGPSLADVRTLLLNAMDDVGDAIGTIEERTGDQSAYLIPNEEIELDPDFVEELEGNLGVTVDGDSVGALVAAFKEVLNGEQTMTVVPEDDVQLVINLGNFFSYDDDLRAWLPSRNALAAVEDMEGLFEVFGDEDNWPDLTFDGTFDEEFPLAEFLDQLMGGDDNGDD